MRKFKKITSFLISTTILVGLTACTSQAVNSSSLNSVTSSALTSSSTSPIISEPLPLEETSYFLGKNDILFFYGPGNEYYKNGEPVTIEGPPTIMRDGMLYLPLEFVFDLFELDGYEELMENGYWENEFGDISISNMRGTENFNSAIETNIYINWYTLLDGKKTITAVDSAAEELLIYDGNLYLSAYSLKAIPASFAENRIERHQAKYFPNMEMLVIYKTITPPVSVFSPVEDKNSGKSWETIYTDIVNGTDPLGIPYTIYQKDLIYPSMHGKGAFIAGYYLHDFDFDNVPEFAINFGDGKWSYLEVFGVEDGHSKFLGDLSLTVIDPVYLEKSTGYLIHINNGESMTYKFENGGFEFIEDYVEFEETINNAGNAWERPIGFAEGYFEKIVFYETIEEAIAAYEASEE